MEGYAHLIILYGCKVCGDLYKVVFARGRVLHLHYLHSLAPLPGQDGRFSCLLKAP